MKRFCGLFISLLFTIYSFADYTGVITTNINELTFGEQDGYDVLTLSKGEYTSLVGQPQLPVKTFTYLIPADVSVSGITVTSNSVVQLSGNYNILPVQEPVPLNIAPSAIMFNEPDTLVYGSNTPYPSNLCEIISDGFARGYHIVKLRFYPVEYLPLSGTVKLHTSISFSINYGTGNSNQCIRPLQQSEYSYENTKSYIKALVENKSDIDNVAGGALKVVGSATQIENLRGLQPTSINFIPDYVIITKEEFIPGFRNLAEWKTKKGVYTIIVDVEDIYSSYQGYDRQEKIRNFIKDAYLNWGISYVLIGGDTEIIPVRFTRITETDWYYSALEGTWNANNNNIFGEPEDGTLLYANVSVGRVPANCSANVVNFVNKVIAYETLQNTTHKNYVKNSLFVAAKTHPNTLSDYCNNLNSLTSDLGVLNAQDYYTLKLYDKQDNGTFINSGQPENGRYFELSSESFINALSTGWSDFGQSYGKFHLVYHIDHSSFNAMGSSSIIKGQSIYRNDVDNLSNGLDYLQIIYSEGCHPNEFSKNSISERFINNENGGCVAFIGNSYYGYPYEANVFVNEFCQKLYNNECFHVGDLSHLSAESSEYTTGGREKRNLLGDPEMSIWTDTPKTLMLNNVNYSNTNKTISGTISVPNPGRSTPYSFVVCAWKDGEVYAVKNVNATSLPVSFTLYNIYPNTSGNIALTVTAHNYIPKTMDVPATISGSNPYIASVGINDSGTDGNGDSQADAGESLSLALIVANSGTTTASNVTAELNIDPNSLYAPYISITHNTSSFGNVGVNSLNMADTPFAITIDEDIFDVFDSQRPNACNVEFDITLRQNSTVFSHKTYNLQIFEPSISKGENIVETNGQSSSLFARLYNIGYAEATGLTATLSLSNPNQTGVSITTATVSYPDIDKVSSGDNSEVGLTPFAITLANGIQLENIAFTLEVSNEFDKTWTFDNFYIVTPAFNANNCSMDHTSDITSISLNWNISTSSTISGYNVYRCLTQNGTYERVNANPVSYRAYMDDNLERMTDYYYKVTFVDNNGNESEGYPADGYRASTSFGMHEGWPISISQSYGTEAWGSPVAYDVFNDNKKEIFFTTGVITSSNETNGGLWGLKEDGDRWLYADGNLTNYSPIVNLGYSSLATPAIADIEGDGEAEIVVTTNLEGNNNGLNMVSYKSTTGNNNGNHQCAIDFGPAQLGGGIVPQSVLLADLDNDGKRESLATTQFLNYKNNPNTGGMKVLNHNGSERFSIGASNFSGQDWRELCGYTMPVAYDFGNGSEKEVVMCTAQDGIFVYDHYGNNYGTNPRISPISGWANDYPPILADIDNNGVMDLMFLSVEILQNGNSRAKICAVETNNFSYLSGWDPTNVQCSTVNLSTHREDSYHSQNVPLFSVGDLNKDGSLEVVYGSAGYVYIYNSNGVITNIISVGEDYNPWIRTIPILADVDDDDSDLEIIVSSYSNTSHLSKIYAYKMGGTLVSGFPLSIPIEIKNSHCVDDIDNDGLNELIVTTAEKVYVWDTYGDCSNNFYGWPMYRRDAQNTATYPICECSEATTTITQDQIWDNNRNLKGDLEISANTTLTVTGTLKMAENAKIIVHPKGKFIVDGGTITNLCPGKMWRGIRVLGDKNKRQLAQYQGTLEIKNGSVISNAKDAISTWDGDDYNTTGGIVKCTNSTFLNNRRSAEFMAYINHTSTGSETSNVSYFKNCNFTIDNNNIFTAAGVTYSDIITMWGVNGVAIRGCHFSDARTGSPTRGNAITLASAGAYIKPSCTYGDYSADFPCSCTGESNNTFNGFAKGVNAENTGTNYPFNVFKANFEKCEKSVSSSAVNSYKVTMSNFDMTRTDNLSNMHGIYSESSTGYKIEGNNFYTTHATNPSGFNSFGISIGYSGSDENTIYRNSFDKLSYGVLSGPDNNSLQVLCNEFTNSFSIDVWAIASISLVQGSSSASAGNKFTIGKANFYLGAPGLVVGSIVNYYHSDANSSNNIYCPYNSYNVTKISNITANGCEPTICLLPTPIDPPIIIGPILGKSATVNDDIALYESLQQIYESRLVEYNNAGYGFLLENFEENDADIVATARLMQDTLISIRRTMAEIANHNIDAILQDTVIFDREALNGWYNRINTQTAKYSLVNSYFEMGEYALARQELAAIPQRFALTTDELAEYDNFCRYQSLRESVYSSGRNYAQLTEDEIAELQRIVERNTGVSSAYANSVLCFFYGICHDEEIDIDFDIDAPMNSKSTTEVVEENAEPLVIYVYPNPADEDLNILLNSLPEGRTMIEFHDVAGRLVLSEEIKSANTSINISSLKQGVYMYRIVNDGNVIARDKIVKE